MSRKDLDERLAALGPDDAVPDDLLDALEGELTEPMGDESARLAHVLAAAADARWAARLADEAWEPDEAELDALEQRAEAVVEPDEDARLQAVLAPPRPTAMGEAPPVPEPANNRTFLRWAAPIALAAAVLLGVIAVWPTEPDPIVYRGDLPPAASDAAFVAALAEDAARVVRDEGDPAWLDAAPVLTAAVNEDGTVSDWRVEAGLDDRAAAELVDVLEGRVQPDVVPPEDSALWQERVQVTLTR